jgi:hypothetical protein
MLDRLQTFFDAFLHALDLMVNATVGVNPWWLAFGVVLHVVHQVVRNRGWFHILRASYPDATDLRARDAVAAFFAGSGLNAVIPARGGDVMKLYLVKRRIPEGRYSTLAATFVPEGLFESFCGIALVAYAFARGFLPIPATRLEIPSIDVTFVLNHPILSSIALVVAVVLLVLLYRWLKRTATRVIERVRQGFAILRSPRAYFTGVVSWQALGRLIRLGSLAAFMAAFGLPVTLESTILVMAAQGGGRIIPLAPASAGLRLAMLSYGLVEVTHQQIDIGRITAFSFGVSFVLLIVSLMIALAIIGKMLGTINPRHAIRKVRESIAERRELEVPVA